MIAIFQISHHESRNRKERIRRVSLRRGAERIPQEKDKKAEESQILEWSFPRYKFRNWDETLQLI